MKIPIKQVGGTGKGLLGIFGFLFKFGLASLFIFITLVSAISLGVSEGSIFPVISEIGGKFIGLTQDLQFESLEIIKSGATFETLWEFIKTIGGFFWIGYAIYLWIKLFNWLFGISPWFNEVESFKTVTFAIITFILFQVLYILLFLEPLIGQTRFDMALTPIFAFKDFFLAIVVIFSSTNFNSLFSFESFGFGVNNTCVDKLCFG